MSKKAHENDHAKSLLRLKVRNANDLHDQVGEG